MNLPNRYLLNVLLDPPSKPDVAWTAYIVEFDVMTVGDTMQDAVSAALDAAVCTISWDHAEGLDPADRRTDEGFDRLVNFMRTSKAPATEDMQDEETKRRFSWLLQVHLQRSGAARSTDEPTVPPEVLLSLAAQPSSAIAC